MQIHNPTDPKLKKILERLVPEFKPSKMYLFGSRANGSATEKSDYDLFFILEKSDLRPIQRMQLASRLLFGVGAKVDVFIYTAEEFEDWKDEFSSIPHTVNTEGLELTVG